MRRLIIFFTPLVLCGARWESAIDYQQDEASRTRRIGTLYSDGVGEQSSVSANYEGAWIEKRVDDSLQNKLWDHRDFIRQHTVGGSFTLGITPQTGITTSGNYTYSEIANSRSYKVSVYQWLLAESMRVQLTYSRSLSAQIGARTTDTDFFVIDLPQNVEGESFGADLQYFVTPKLINVTRTYMIVRPDRPSAKSIYQQWRYHFPSVSTAIHVSGSYYENVGEIKPVTLQGEIRARAIQGDWYQYFARDYLTRLSYRNYSESDDPRDPLADVRRSSSSLWSLRTSWFWGEGLATDDRDQLYFFGAIYSSDDGDHAWQSGLGIVTHY